jgi:hypothetical protein
MVITVMTDDDKYDYDDAVDERLQLDRQETRNKPPGRTQKREAVLEDTRRARHWVDK